MFIPRFIPSPPFSDDAFQWGLRLLSLVLFGVSFGWALYTMLHNMHPSKDNFELYEENDDWGRS